MKTAISISDDLFEAADRMARNLGMSRSELYARAVASYLEIHEEELITRRLDMVYPTRPYLKTGSKRGNW
jgi:metal-responsive CopG/Arc/MetJ family transcriptional regulator